MEIVDETIVESFRKMPNPHTFRPLVLRYQAQLYNVAYKMTGNHEETEEMVQEAFLRAYVSFNQLHKSSAFYAWLLKIVNNLCRDLLRVKQRRRAMHLFSLDQVHSSTSVAEVVDCNSDPALKLEEFEQITVIEKSLARLPIDQRIVLILRDIEGLTYTRIADITGTNLGTVRSRLHYARLKLRIMLEPYLSGCSFARGLNIEPIKPIEPRIAMQRIPVAVARGQRQ